MSAGDAPATPAGVYRRLLRYTTRYWRVLIVAAIALLAYAVTDTGFAALMKPLLDEGLLKQDMGAVRRVLPLVVVLSLLRGLAGFVSEYAMTLVARRVITNLRAEVFEHFLIRARTGLGPLADWQVQLVEQ